MPRTLALFVLLLLGFFRPADAASIAPGTPTTSVPTYLSDGSYIFGITVTLGPDQFLLPIDTTGASQLQNWQFDLSFDATVAQEVDPFDGSSGIYGGEFVPGDPTTISFIQAGFPFNALGLVSGVAGSYPSLLDGVSGDGVLAYILFQFQTGHETDDPGFAIDNVSVQEAVPEPSSLSVLALGVLVIGLRGKLRPST